MQPARFADDGSRAQVLPAESVDRSHTRRHARRARRRTAGSEDRHRRQGHRRGNAAVAVAERLSPGHPGGFRDSRRGRVPPHRRSDLFQGPAQGGDPVHVGPVGDHHEEGWSQQSVQAPPRGCHLEEQHGQPEHGRQADPLPQHRRAVLQREADLSGAR